MAFYIGTALDLILKTQCAAFIVLMTALTKVGKREMVRSEVSY
jgi:hypothetical protein